MPQTVDVIDDLDLYPAHCSIDGQPAQRARVALHAGRLRVWIQSGAGVQLLVDQHTSLERHPGILTPRYIAEIEGVGRLVLAQAGKPCGCGGANPLDAVDPNA